MKRLFYFILLFFTLSLNAQNITISKDSWILSSSSYDVLVSDLNLHAQDVLWKYDGGWKYYKEDIDSKVYDKIKSIKSGEGFWIKSSYDYTLQIPNNSTDSETTLRFGWNLMGPNNSDINLTSDTKYTSIAYAWIYENNSWKLWIKDGKKQFDTIKVGSGAWLYSSTGYIVQIGDFKTPLVNGIFDKVYKSSSDSVENIWNISFIVKVKDISSFSIGIKFLKKSSGATGEIIYSGLNLSNGKISSPNFINIKGTKGNGDNSSTSYNNGYDPQNIRVNSIELNGDLLTVKLGTIMSKQTSTSEDTFKAISDYNVTIVPEKLEVVGGSHKELINLGDFVHTYSGIGISGDIEIQ